MTNNGKRFSFNNIISHQNTTNIPANCNVARNLKWGRPTRHKCKQKIFSTHILLLKQFSLQYKQESAHEESIWSCSWGRIITPAKQKEPNDDPDASQDSLFSNPEDSQPKIDDFIVTGGLDDLVKIWELKDNRLSLRKELSGHSLGVVSVAVSTDGQTIASSSLDSGLCFWRSETGDLINQSALGPVDLWTVAFSPCDKYVISGSHEGKISLYSVETGKAEQVLDPQNGKFTLSIAYVSCCACFDVFELKQVFILYLAKCRYISCIES